MSLKSTIKSLATPRLLIENVAVPVLASILAVLLILLTGCNDPSPSHTPRTEQAQDPLVEKIRTEERNKTKALVDAAQKRVEDAITKANDAKAKGDRLAELYADKEVLSAQAARAGTIAREQADLAKKYQGEAHDLEAQIKDERIKQAQEKLYWFAGAMTLLALVGAGVALWLPLVRTKAATFAVAVGGVAALAVTVAGLLAYLWWVGGVLLLVGIGTALFTWHKEHRTLGQVVESIEQVKTSIPDYKGHFAKTLDTDVEKVIAKVRLKKGLDHDPKPLRRK